VDNQEIIVKLFDLASSIQLKPYLCSSIEYPIAYMSQKKPLPKFPVTKDSLHATLKRNVQQYFANNEISQHGNLNLYVKAGILIAAFVGLYLHLILGDVTWWLAVIECAILGLVVAMIGFNIMHDGNHGSFSGS